MIKFYKIHKYNTGNEISNIQILRDESFPPK